MFVGLRGKGGGTAKIARPDTAPFGPHRMGAIFDQTDIMRGTDFNNAVHIGDMPPHVREQQKLGPTARRFCIQIIQINMIILVNINQHRHTANIMDCARYRRQSIGVGQYLIPTLDAANPHR